MIADPRDIVADALREIGEIQPRDVPALGRSAFLLRVGPAGAVEGSGGAAVLEQSRATAAFDGTTWTNPQQEGGSTEGWHVAWLNFTDLAQSVRDDVARIRKHPLTPDTVPVHGFIYDVKNGELVPVD